ncbi:MAG: hypothetical protein DRN04_09530 [Thermoprotei archaeon]|nr:MAG: hypothetical protein DRN04_09530 [Thermoprotei archaeon]
MLNKFRKYFEKNLNTAAKALLRLGLTPNLCTAISLAIGFFSAFLIAAKMYTAAALMVLTSGYLDALDGTLARLTRGETKTGAFIDSMFDRIVDSTVLLALMYSLISESRLLDSMLAALFMALSLMISYARARAESLGIQIKGVGLMERAERLIFLTILLILLPYSPGLSTPLLAAADVLAGVTLTERIYKTIKLSLKT